jgi:hypothetical protein
MSTFTSILNKDWEDVKVELSLSFFGASYTSLSSDFSLEPMSKLKLSYSPNNPNLLSSTTMRIAIL